MTTQLSKLDSSRSNLWKTSEGFLSLQASKDGKYVCWLVKSNGESVEIEPFYLSGLPQIPIQQIEKIVPLVLNCYYPVVSRSLPDEYFVRFHGRGLGGMNNGGLFNALQNSELRAFASTAPKWRIISAGLNLEGTCETRTCEAYQKTVWCQKGLKNKYNQTQFNLLQETEESPCPVCEKSLKNVTNVGFYNCQYTIDGSRYPTTEPRGTPEKVEFTSIIRPGDNYQSYPSGDIRWWKYLNIIINAI